MMDNTAS